MTGFGFEQENPLSGFPNFYFFTAYVSTPGAQGNSGQFAVNKFTGEVWDPFGCWRLSNPKLLKLQGELRIKLGLTPPEYKRRAKENPCLV
jgi:hypothetical protein